MFQNIREETIDSSKENKFKGKINIFANIFAKKYVIIYIVSFMLSLVNLTGEVSPFSISIMAACFANSVPAMGIIIVSLIGNAIKFGPDGAISYILTVAVMVITFFLIKPKYNEEQKNEQIKMGANIFIATLVIQLAKCFMTTFTIYDILASITFTIITYVFYKIFVNSIPVLENIREKKAFTIEEVIGTSLLIAIAISCIGDFQVLGVSIRNILSILIVLVLGWKNGVLVGTTAGVTIGITLGVITGTEPIMIAAYAISGMMAGILNRFGKIGVIVGFTLGNVVLAYVSNGYTIELIHFKEILIASIGLLAIPKSINLNIEEFGFNKKFLPTLQGRALNKSKEMAENLNNVSEAIHDMAETYKETEKLSFDDNTEELRNKEIFVAELLNNLEPYKENMIYPDVTNTEGKILDKIFKQVMDKQEIDNTDLIEIFKQCNSYIVGFDDIEISEYLNQNISQVVRAINTSYRICKSDFIWQKKIDEVNKNAKNQLNNVSKAIKGIAINLKDDLETQKEYNKEIEDIILQLKNIEIKVEEISIRKNIRFFIEIYLKQNEETMKINKIEKILTKVLKESIVLNEEDGIGTRLSFLSKDKYIMNIAVAEETKSESEASGDSVLNIRLKDGNYLVALSDGMGSGKEAKKSSMQAIRMLENLLLSGFDKQTSLDLINTALITKNDEIFATLDIAIIDLYQGKIEFIKSGACPSYIKNRKKVQIIKASSLPTGIIDENKLAVYDRDMKNNDILLMCSDGILDSNIEYKNKELWLKYTLEDIETENTKKIANLVLTESIDNFFGRIQDDLSVVVCKFKKGEEEWIIEEKDMIQSHD